MQDRLPLEIVQALFAQSRTRRRPDDIAEAYESYGPTEPWEDVAELPINEEDGADVILGGINFLIRNAKGPWQEYGAAGSCVVFYDLENPLHFKAVFANGTVYDWTVTQTNEAPNSDWSNAEAF